MFAKMPWLKKIIIIVSFFCMMLLLMPSLSETLLLSLVGGLFMFLGPDRDLPKLSIKRLVFASIMAACLIAFYFFYLAEFNDISSMSFILTYLLYGILSIVFIYLLTISCERVAYSSGSTSDHAKNTHIYSLFAFVFSLVVMLFVSQSSPLYVMNFWDDSNIYHTVARAMLNGKLLYRDIYDQKGPLMFFIQMPGVMLSPRNFWGMYITEAVAVALWIIVSYKCITLFVKPGKITFLLFSPLSMLALISHSFHYGGSAEEFLLPIFGYTLYIGIKCIKEERFFANKEAFIIGVLSSIVFWTKYNLCGIFLGFIVFVIIYAVKCRQLNKLCKLVGAFLIGFFIICIPVGIYYVINGSLKDLFEGYFDSIVSVYIKRNRTMYAESATVRSSDSPFLIGFVKDQVSMFIANYKYEHILFLSFFASFIYLASQKNKKMLMFFILTLGSCSLGIFGMGFQMPYYLMGLKAFVVFAFIPLFILIEKVESKFTNKAMVTFLSAFAALCLTATVIVESPSLFMLGRKRDEYPQFQIADIIAADGISDPKIINYGFLDSGFFLACDVLPFNTHYCTKYYFEEQNELIKAHEADYIITKGTTYEWEGYELIYVSSTYEMDWDGRDTVDNTFYLYRLRPKDQAY